MGFPWKFTPTQQLHMVYYGQQHIWHYFGRLDTNCLSLFFARNIHSFGIQKNFELVPFHGIDIVEI